LSDLIAIHDSPQSLLLRSVEIQGHRQLTHIPSFSPQVLAGISLRTEEVANAFVRVYFNLFVQVFNFGVVSSIVFGFSRLMIEVGAISKAIGDGMVICACLSITVNVCVVMTIGAGGGETSIHNFFSTLICSDHYPVAKNSSHTLYLECPKRRSCCYF
jgi:hypothetical protein